ncbi:MAG TPA: response regulator transcription factor [Ramlibacter sp.]|nr:response regulator transcription factor [Ramlibacter sp.]
MAATTRIVIAEDHVLLREGLKMLLATQPQLQVVAETGDGRLVEGMVREAQAQLLVLDLGLPGKHGVDIAGAVKGAFGDAVKVLVLTGDLSPTSVRLALAAGADGYMHKSEDTSELLDAVTAVLAGRQYVSRRIAQVFQPDAAGAPAPTPREQEIMSLVAKGLANKEIAEVLDLSVATVRTHRQNFMEKFALRNAAEITAFAVQQGYYNPA